MKNRLPSIHDINVGDLLFLRSVVVYMILSKPESLNGGLFCSLFGFPSGKIEYWMIGKIERGQVNLFYDIHGME